MVSKLVQESTTCLSANCHFETIVSISSSTAPKVFLLSFKASVNVLILPDHLCVKPDYDDTTRIIEPYSLRRTREGNLLFFILDSMFYDG